MVHKFGSLKKCNTIQNYFVFRFTLFFLYHNSLGPT
uniref:Uncharacterized protein n=1 Tax=Anguilla anguilla TaxID=7936 RepID=A0A0E9UAQ0_ANGAN